MRKKFALSSIISIIVFFICLYTTMNLKLTNVQAYVLSVIVSSICFVMLFGLFTYKLSRLFISINTIKLEYILNKKIWGGFPIVFVLLFMGIILILDNNTAHMLGKYIFIYKYDFVIAILASFVLYFVLKRFQSIKWIILRRSLECINLIVCAWIGFKPNVLEDTFNYNAYWLNVVQIYNHVPFDKANLSFYGHYSLLMLPYFKILGLSAITIALLQAIENLLICIAITYCIHKITDNELLRLCGIIGILYYVGGTAFHYPQGFPHRLVFMAVIFALGCKISYSESKKTGLLFGYLVSLFAIIWNTETGVTVLVAWSIFSFLHSYLFSKKWKEKIKLCIGSILLIPVVFLCSWKIVSLLNKLYLRGEWIPLDEFLFPLQNSNFVETLSIGVEFGVSSWVIIMILFLSIFFWGIKDLILQKGSREKTFFVFISAMGLMNLVYFFNRAAWGNLRLVAYYPCILICLYLIKKINILKGDTTIRNLIKEGILIGGISIFILMLVIFITHFPKTYTAMKKYQDINKMNNYFKELDEKIPFNVKELDNETAFNLIESQKIKDGFYESVVNYSLSSMNETREKLLKAEFPFMVESRMYITNYLYAWKILSENELQQLYKEYSFEHEGAEFIILYPKNK